MAAQATSLRERKKEEMRDTLLDAALALFEEQGFAATTVEEIAARADVAPRTFFRYFPNKTATLQAAKNQYLDALAELIIHTPADAPILTVLHGAMRQTLAMFHEDRDRIVRQHRICFDANLDPHEDEFANLWRGFEQAIADRLGTDPTTDPRVALLTGIGVGIASGAVRAWLDEGATGDLGVLVDRGFDELTLLTATPTSSE